MDASKLNIKQFFINQVGKLPIHKCYVNEFYEDAGLANVFICRKHVTGKITIGIFLIDLMCLGVKDVHFIFNEAEEDVLERIFGDGVIKEIDYNLAHNIVYAGYEYALELGINAHKDFSFVKYILEPDDDKIPLIDVKTGDKDGKPHLIVDNLLNYSHVIKMLIKTQGEGNFQIGIYANDKDED